TTIAERSAARRRRLLTAAWVLGLATVLAVAMTAAWQIFASPSAVSTGTTQTCTCDEHPNCSICNSGREHVPGACAEEIPASRMYRLRLAGASLFDRKTGKKFVP